MKAKEIIVVLKLKGNMQAWEEWADVHASTRARKQTVMISKYKKRRRRWSEGPNHAKNAVSLSISLISSVFINFLSSSFIFLKPSCSYFISIHWTFWFLYILEMPLHFEFYTFHSHLLRELWSPLCWDKKEPVVVHHHTKSAWHLDWVRSWRTPASPTHMAKCCYSFLGETDTNHQLAHKSSASTNLY